MQLIGLHESRGETLLPLSPPTAPAAPHCKEEMHFISAQLTPVGGQLAVKIIGVPKRKLP